MNKVAVILSGSGVFDGAEIHESVLTMLALSQRGVAYQCFAPDISQLHVVNHLTGDVVETEPRNVLVEAARIARGNVLPVSALAAVDYDALLVPGGFGAAKNLCNFALVGANCQVEPSVLRACREFAELAKPTGYMCIAPVLAARVYGEGVRLTIGNDKETADALRIMGAEHVDCEVDDIVVDKTHKLVTTPAYMLAKDIAEAAQGINKLVDAVLAFR
ncbi:isoprenoid biosynthesis glyoxalase ElbB [Bowmanella sp. Y26]|uniref:Glyoxalase n=1 Tax=Bowmanella yangjiangensis TaxID=2811230 RepID=A0ABS3CZR3_9ALTE|nr:isoprenoid biosynthesis glyoxalase ElbB [Bowmanella yangjiangensis]MBN7821845.1 isoprenoid biosynthesis glyoxalase ElbB [Bowmanella yangjiangensis]MBT1063828.1 isoprenoid biosynthesis glyoxalase ElbB [Bowmanella yangjiangensis]